MQVFQRWVFEAIDEDYFVRRAKLASFAVSGIGLIEAIILGFSLPVVSTWLFGRQLTLSVGESWATAASLVAIAISYAVSSFILAPTGRSRAITVSLLVGSVMGIPLIYFAATYYGTLGALLAVALIECAVAIYQVCASRSALRRLSVGTVPA